MAWEMGDIEQDGARVKILPDLSRGTLQRKIKSAGGTYRWGYPISLTVKKNSLSYILIHPRDLPDLFSFLAMEAFEILNWLQVIPGQTRSKEHTGRGRNTTLEEIRK